MGSPDVSPTGLVLAEVAEERKEQDEEWGGAAHDDQHGSNDWIAYIAKHVGKAVWYMSAGQHGRATFRYQMIRVAALAVAAVEWCDRLEPRRSGK